MIVEIHENHYDVKPLAEGSALITITPVYDGIPYENGTIKIHDTNMKGESFEHGKNNRCNIR